MTLDDIPERVDYRTRPEHTCDKTEVISALQGIITKLEALDGKTETEKGALFNRSFLYAVDRYDYGITNNYHGIFVDISANA